MEDYAMFVYILAGYWGLDGNPGRERHLGGFETQLNRKPLVKPA